MNLALALARVYLPPSIRKNRLEKLWACTASAFGFDPPPLDGLNLEESLTRYAELSKLWAEEALRRGETELVQARLYQQARQLGGELREQFHVGTPEEVISAARLVYRAIGIEMQGSPQGTLTISHCFFSSYYPPAVCRLISALDEGVLAGLSDGGRLAFTQRLTEGHSCCKATLSRKG